MHLLSRLLPVLLALGVACPAHADSIETFAMDGGGAQTLEGDTLTVTREDIEVGDISFDATLTVVGSADLSQIGSGLGVKGGSNPINAGEWLSFSLDVANVSGGLIAFDGFVQLDLTFFGAEGEQAVFSYDASVSSTCDNFFTAEGSDDDPADISSWLPTAFTLFGNDAGGTVSFRVDSIDASFSEIEPVPEPSTLALLGTGLALMAVHRRRRART